MRTYYEILGIAERAAPEEVKRAYRHLVRQFHPDLAGQSGTPSFREVREAYETLSDERRRHDYDARLRACRRPPPPIASPREWFADEVAIDFLPASAIVDRILRTFSGVEDATRRVLAQILVSPREASEGVEVPLDVPVRGACPRCGGRGETWAECCRACAGTGERHGRHRVLFSIPAGVRDGTRFRFSVGTDFVPTTLVEVRVVVD